jgi:hypothetical protein
MLYRYCRAILDFPPEVQWAIFHLNDDGSTGRLLRQVDHNMVAPGNYVILDQGKYDASERLLKLLIDGTDREPVAISVTSDRAPRRVYSRSPSSSQIARDRNSLVKITKKPHHHVDRWLNFLLQQGYFRNAIRERDRTCAISGRTFRSRHRTFNALQAAHIYPVSRLSEWNAQNYRRWISDTSSQHHIGQSGLYSLQNGLLLKADIHQLWDSWVIGVDPDVRSPHHMCMGQAEPSINANYLSTYRKISRLFSLGRTPIC